MQYEIEVGGRTRQVTVTHTGATFAVTVDGRTRTVDAIRIGGSNAASLSLILDNMWSSEVVIAHGAHGAADRAAGQAAVTTVTVDGLPVMVTLNGRRRGRRPDATQRGSGPQRLTAPMPGKVVRVLVATGATVRAKQPLVVVEAMKMENELRAGRDGTVTEVPAREGQSVDAGALLVVIQ